MSRRDPARCRREEAPRTLGEIRARRRVLVERAAVEREALAGATAGLLPAFAAGDKVVGLGRSILAHPFLLAAAGGLLLVLWPRAVFAAAWRGVAVWRGARAAARGLAALAR